MMRTLLFTGLYLCLMGYYPYVATGASVIISVPEDFPTALTHDEVEFLRKYSKNSQGLDNALVLYLAALSRTSKMSDKFGDCHDERYPNHCQSITEDFWEATNLLAVTLKNYRVEQGKGVKRAMRGMEEAVKELYKN